jgi:hypothetical protein
MSSALVSGHGLVRVRANVSNVQLNRGPQLPQGDTGRVSLRLFQSGFVSVTPWRGNGIGQFSYTKFLYCTYCDRPRP